MLSGYKRRVEDDEFNEYDRERWRDVYNDAMEELEAAFSEGCEKPSDVFMWCHSDYLFYSDIDEWEEAHPASQLRWV